jgi:hypothetical protein
LEAVGLQVREQEEQAIVWRGQGAVFVHAKLAGGAGFAIEAPRGHMGLEGGLEGWEQLLKFVERQAGQIQKLGGAILHLSEL